MQIKVQAMGDYQTNCYIVTINDKDLIIDPGMNSLPWIKEQVNNPIAVLNTHGHFDHVWSNDIVCKTYNIKLHTPKKDIFMLSMDSYGLGMPHSAADVEIEEDEEIEIQGIKIKFHFFPGHTPGCSMIQIDKDLFSGDFIFKDSIGRCDFPYSNVEDMKHSLKKVLSWEKDYNIHPGHGISTTLKAENNSLVQWLNYL
ncbi:MAG: MBL fold metallo-hydrolase [Campylobacteraceae bacterium]|nr:MBL fold metallo-hydrolase [Campylobacteraceae bacterium]